MPDELSSIRIQQIMQMLPHRYPFLLVDRVTAYTPGDSLEAYKNVTFNEPFFQGHFPGLPVMPGVLILEALAQAGGLLVSVSSPEPLDGKVFLFTGMDKVRFRRPVVPGDKLEMRAHDVRAKFKLWKMNGTATVNGDVVAEAVLTAAVIDREDV
ncbi:MAG: 3-hydroxyacyl-ACP dehydratase FabZ [Desulfovibrionaceae bacterium]|jgi:3-hydroxyacyl-[acyl-carrier-protein] dehydratase|nr:3-hydroxyacyl-ACP dehydratase FabZ [Desulfovibrionaceae bacterium]